MKEKIKNRLGTFSSRNFFSLYNVSVVVIFVITFSILWAGFRVIQRNYELLKQVSVLEQEVGLLKVSVANQKLMNEYYSTESYMEISARRLLNKALPGEKLMLVPKSLALEQVPNLVSEKNNLSLDNKQELSNWQKWIRFLSGKSLED